MRKLYYAALLCLPLPGLAQTEQVHIAGIGYPVLFADTNLSSNARQRIASDLTLVFSRTLSFDDAKDEGVYGLLEATVPLPGGGTAIETDIGRDYWAGVFKPDLDKTMFPTKETREGVFIADHNGQRSIRVGNAASSNYLHAFALMASHSNAVRKAREFVELVNSPGLYLKPAQELRDMFRVSPEDQEAHLSDSDLRQFASEVLAPRECPGLSALHFRTERRPELDGAEVLVMYLYLFKRPLPTDDGFGLPVLFHDGRWGFGRFW